MTALRVCFVGDSIVNGYGDDEMLSWTGRICAAAAAAGHDVTRYDLGIRGDTSTLIRGRWRDSVTARLPEAFKGAIVFGYGINDCVRLDGKRRVDPAVSVANTRAMLAEAKSLRPTLFIGPTPIDRRLPVPQFYPGIRVDLDDDDIAALNGRLLAAAAEIGVPALDLYGPLSGSAAWSAEIGRGDGVHPPAGGYRLMAEAIGAWPDWRRLFEDVD